MTTNQPDILIVGQGQHGFIQLPTGIIISPLVLTFNFKLQKREEIIIFFHAVAQQIYFSCVIPFRKEIPFRDRDLGCCRCSYFKQLQRGLRHDKNYLIRSAAARKKYIG